MRRGTGRIRSAPCSKGVIAALSAGPRSLQLGHDVAELPAGQAGHQASQRIALDGGDEPKPMLDARPGVTHSDCQRGAGTAAMRGSRYMMDWRAARTELDDLRAQKLTANARK